MENFKKESLFRAMTKLVLSAQKRGRWSLKMQRKFETIDNKATKIMLQAEKNCKQTFRYHTPWSLPLIQASKAIRYWKLKISLSKGRKIAPTVIDSALKVANTKDCTDTFKHDIIERNLARIKLRDHIKNAESMREADLKKKAEYAAIEGDEKLTRSYETLIENEKCKSKWRKIKYHLKSGGTEPLTRLLVTEEGASRILTDGKKIQDVIIDHNIKHFSEAEDTPL